MIIRHDPPAQDGQTPPCAMQQYPARASGVARVRAWRRSPARGGARAERSVGPEDHRRVSGRRRRRPDRAPNRGTAARHLRPRGHHRKQGRCRRTAGGRGDQASSAGRQHDHDDAREPAHALPAHLSQAHLRPCRRSCAADDDAQPEDGFDRRAGESRQRARRLSRVGKEGREEPDSTPRRPPAASRTSSA